jgi:hypothetical protein
VPLNERQTVILNHLLDGFEGKLTTSKDAALAKSSQDTALREILQLVEQGILWFVGPNTAAAPSYTVATEQACNANANARSVPQARQRQERCYEPHRQLRNPRTAYSDRLDALNPPRRHQPRDAARAAAGRGSSISSGVPSAATDSSVDAVMLVRRIS